jgi:hypothetical protein
MKYISIDLQSILILTLFSTIVYGISSSKNTDLVEQTIEAVQECMESGPVPWPDEWKKEYLDTIRKAILTHQNTPQYNRKLEILHKGFALFWNHIKKSKCSATQFKVYIAEIRWYIEHLMREKLSSKKEREILKIQYRELFVYAIESLRGQFPFIKRDITDAALQKGLQQSYERIDAPLMPIYSKPFTDNQIKRIKARWDSSHTNRSGLWSKFSSNVRMQGSDVQVTNPKMHPHYVFTKRCISSLLGSIWRVAVIPPDYCVMALQQSMEESKELEQEFRYNSASERRLISHFGTRIEQVEQWSFIFKGLLETACEQKVSNRTAYNEQDSGMPCNK